MKVSRVESRIVSVPFKEPLVWGFGKTHGSSAVLVRVETDDGITGWGETTGPYNAITIKAAVDHDLAPQLVGEDPFEIERIHRKWLASGMLWVPDLAVFPMSALEMALWDIIGKATGQPVSRLLGGQLRPRVDFAAYLFIKPAEQLVEDARRAVAEGFRVLKLKVGLDPQLDVRNVRAVREAVGDSVQIRVDANQAWATGTAVTMLNKLAPFDLQYAEQPVHRDDFEGMARVRRASPVPIAANEAVYTTQDALRCIRAEAADVIVTDIHNPGGILEAKKLCAICEAAGIPVVLHSGAELGVATAARLHLIASTPNFIYASDTHYHHMAGDIITQPFRFEEGAIAVPAAPGLGVEVDLDQVERYSRMPLYSAFTRGAETPVERLISPRL